MNHVAATHWNNLHHIRKQTPEMAFHLQTCGALLSNAARTLTAIVAMASSEDGKQRLRHAKGASASNARNHSIIFVNLGIL